jgi:hypothetical protein
VISLETVFRESEREEEVWREENKGLKTWNDENILGKTRFVKRLK